MSYKIEVIADGSGNWAGNDLRFETEGEADDYARDLAFRWTLVRDWRVVPTDAPVNYRWDNGLKKL